MVVAFSLESFDHPTNEVRGDPGLRPDGMSEFRVSGFSPRKMAHLSDDKTVAKMGHPDLLWVRPGPPARTSKVKRRLSDKN